MASKLDTQKTKQQLFHSSISLAVTLICMTYMQYKSNWLHIGSLWNSLILPIVFTGELLKVLLCHYYDKSEYRLKQENERSFFSIKDFVGAIILQFLCIIIFAFTCIILGAPVLHKYEQTFVLSLLLTILSVTPTVLLLGGGGALEVCFCEKLDFLTKGENTALHLFKYNALGGILGAWTGSIVAPLDWDRDWQEYPIPNVVGALLGSALANICACTQVLFITGRAYVTKKCS